MKAEALHPAASPGPRDMPGGCGGQEVGCPSGGGESFFFQSEPRTIR